MRRALTYIKDFGSVTTLHGVNHIVASNRHHLEVYLWVAVTLIACATSSFLIVDSWQRYSANPSVISLEKDFRSWQLPFPAVTVCLLDRLNHTTASELIQRLWKLKPSDKKYDYYKRFVQSVANLTYDNLGDFLEFQNDTELYNIDLAVLAERVQINFTYDAFIFNPKYKHLRFHDVITEMGICHTYNGVLAEYVSLRKDVRKTLTEDLDLPTCNVLNSVCYGRAGQFPGSLKYFVHSPWELPDSFSIGYLVFNLYECDSSFQFVQTVASPDLRDLYPRQRRCRFLDEPLQDSPVPLYSYNLCRMMCRQRLSYTLCGCAPYFYMPMRGIPVCTVKGLACLAQHKQLITNLISADGSKQPCPCTLPCSNIEYYNNNLKLTSWVYPVQADVRFRWAIEIYSKTRLRRNIIYGFEDLLVSFGGTAALFLGCSVITFVELLYFFSLRLFWFLRSRDQVSTRNTRRRIKVIRYQR